MGCNHDCDHCSQSCGGEQDLHEPLNQYSSVKHVIGVVSGKGGVGKSMVTSQLAVTMNRRGLKTAILDADITGPSIPKAFGIHERAKGSDLGILPAVTETGIEIMSINLLLKEETDPVVWRSPMIVGTVSVITALAAIAFGYGIPYASGNRRYSAYRFPEPSARRNHRSRFSAGACFDDR